MNDILAFLICLSATITGVGLSDIVILGMQLREIDRCSIWDPDKATFVDEDGIGWKEACDFGRVSKFGGCVKE